MLQLRTGLNDDIMHYFSLMLAKRDAVLCSTTNTDANNTTKKLRSHFSNRGCATNDGLYEYRSFKRWSKNIPGKNIFALDRIFFPINRGCMYWMCAVIFMQQQKNGSIFFDSMGSDGKRYYLDALLFQYLKDEHVNKKITPLPDRRLGISTKSTGDTTSMQW